MSWLKPRIWPFIIGAIFTMVLGFTWGGWMTAGGADRVAYDRSQTAVTTALVSVCLEKSKADPGSVKKLGTLRGLTAYEQRDAILKDGWASVGAGEGNRDVAEACAAQLTASASK